MIEFDDGSIDMGLTKEIGGPVDFCGTRDTHEYGYSIFIMQQENQSQEIILSEKELKAMLKAIKEFK